MPGDIQVQAGQGSKQSVLAVDVPVNFRDVGLDDLLMVPSNSNNSMILFY